MINIENMLPQYYKKSKYIHGLLNPCNIEFDRLNNKLDSTLNNMFVDDADSDGLNDFEMDFLIPTSNDSINLRRSKVKAKFLRPATTTFENLKNIVTAFDEAAVVCVDNSNYKINIQTFNRLLFQDIMKNVDDIKPAHIGVNYNVTIDDILSSIYTGGEIIGIKKNIFVSANAIRRDNIVTDVFTGGSVVGVRRNISVTAAESEIYTYADIMECTYAELKEKTYSQLCN